MRVYLASPYTVGDTEGNVERAIKAGMKILDLGHAPYIPHLSHFLDKRYPRDYETWMKLDFDFLAVCDAFVRLPGRSPGADREEVYARRLRKLMFNGLEEFVEWDADRKRCNHQ